MTKINNHYKLAHLLNLVSTPSRSINFRSSISRTSAGFTIVELLIVIVVIGILAAISIVAYNGIQNRASNTAIKNDLANIAKRMELYKVDHDVYPNNSVSQIQKAFDGLKVSRDAYGDGVVTAPGTTHNLLYCTTPDFNNYGVLAWGKNGDGFAIINGKVQAISQGPTGSIPGCPIAVPSYHSHRWIHNVGSWLDFA